MQVRRKLPFFFSIECLCSRRAVFQMRARPVRARANLYARGSKRERKRRRQMHFSAHTPGFRGAGGEGGDGPPTKKRRDFGGAPRRDFARQYRRGRPTLRYVALRGGPVPGEAGAEKARARARGVSRKAGATRRRPRKRAPPRREFAGAGGRNAARRGRRQNAFEITNPTQNTVRAIDVKNRYKRVAAFRTVTPLAL